MSRKGIRLGNKKSAILALYGLYNANAFYITRDVIAGQTSLKSGATKIVTNIADNPVGTLGPMAVGWWMWGKPVYGVF